MEREREKQGGWKVDGRCVCMTRTSLSERGGKKRKSGDVIEEEMRVMFY